MLLVICVLRCVGAGQVPPVFWVSFLPLRPRFDRSRTRQANRPSHDCLYVQVDILEFFIVLWFAGAVGDPRLVSGHAGLLSNLPRPGLAAGYGRKDAAEVPLAAHNSFDATQAPSKSNEVPTTCLSSGSNLIRLPFPAGYGRKDAAEVLLAAGAVATVTNTDGQTPSQVRVLP